MDNRLIDNDILTVQPSSITELPLVPVVAIHGPKLGNAAIEIEWRGPVIIHPTDMTFGEIKAHVPQHIITRLQRSTRAARGTVYRREAFIPHGDRQEVP